MKKIKNIIQSHDSNLVKLIEIAREIKMSEKEISEAFKISEIMLNEYIPSVFPEVVKNDSSGSQTEYVKLFDDAYLKIFGRKYTYMKKDFKMFSYIKKAINYEQFREMLILVYKNNKKIASKSYVKKTWNFICENFTPAIMYNQINFFMNELSCKKDSNKEFRWK